MNTNMKAKKLRIAGLFVSLAVFLTAPGWAVHEEDTSYSFARVLEGPSTVITADGERESLETHMPFFVGDRLWVPYDSRLEVVLADRSVLRIEGNAEIDFSRVAYSADTYDPSTELQLRDGEIQLVVPEDVLGETLPVIVTPDATVYVHEPGEYRVTVSREGWTELVVRQGRAEVVDDRNASLVYPGDMAVVEGGPRPGFEIRLAGSSDALERWGYRLTREASYASVPQVEHSLHYVAAPLAEHGVWVTIGSRSAWRPRVAVTWRPYYNGYWRSGPSGLLWVSSDPWGHVTHHYGLWDYVPGYGWVWYPGRTYRTAWVHWYWGPDYVGWCPSGYYASYHGGGGYGSYGHGHGSGFGVSFGIYGWAGGSWNRFEHWSFTATADFGRHDQHRHVYSGKAMAQVVSGRELGRGIITTDPGAAGRKNPREIVNLLESEVRDYRVRTGRDLPDVSDYVARKPLARDLREAIVNPKPLTRAKPAPGSRPSVVSREYPGSSSTRKAPGLTGRETVAAPRPSTKPYGVSRPEDPGREREGTVRRDVRDWRDRVSEPRDRTPEVKPRPRDEDRTIRVSPRDVRRYDEPRSTSPRRESPSPTIREEVRRYQETPRARSPEPETSKPTVLPSRPSVSSSKPTVRSKPSVSSSKPTVRSKPSVSSSKPTVRSKPSVSSSKPTVRSKPSVRSNDRGRSERSSGRSSKSSSTVKKSQKKKDH